MKKHIARIALFSLVAAGLVAVPAASRADDASAAKSDKPAAATPPPASKKKSHTFHGDVTAVDTAAMTLTVGTNTIYVTSETIIKKGETPATLSEITVGETANGTCKVDDAGKMNATAIHVVEKGTKKPKKKTSDTAPAAPPAPPK